MNTNLAGIWPLSRTEEIQCLAAGRTNESVGKEFFQSYGLRWESFNHRVLKQKYSIFI